MGYAGKISALVIAVFAIFVYFKVKSIFDVPPVPKLDEIWWGPGDPNNEDTTIRPFKINVSDDVLKDLQTRLARALPFQEPLEGAKQHYGINTNLLKTIVDFWKTKYNWREREKFLNQYPQYKVSVQGLKIHYIHVKPIEKKGMKVLPLLLLHGWPGSVREFYETIPILTKSQKGRDFVFEVIIPSLPGFGFSDAAVRPGLSSIHVGIIFKNLMKRLGFEKYYIQGGDWGAIIVQQMAALFPEKIIGVHSNGCFSSMPISILKLLLGNYFPSLVATKEEAEKMFPASKVWYFNILESGYMHLQATKPDTVGVALRDSPVGLAAYILEKFIAWTNPHWKDLDDGGLTNKYTYTNLLDNVMIYWVTRSVTTSMRLYSESFNIATSGLKIDNIPIQVPSSCSKFRYELVYQSAYILKDRFPNLIHSPDYDGGHFAAFEEPNVLANDVFIFAEKVEKLKKTV